MAMMANCDRLLGAMLGHKLAMMGHKMAMMANCDRLLGAMMGHKMAIMANCDRLLGRKGPNKE